MSRFPRSAFVALLIAVAAPAMAAPTTVETVSVMRSATKARDIGGFALGMSIRDANKLSPMEDIGNSGYRTKRDGIEYDFGVTQLGRIYRVQSSQFLGRFDIDAIFLRALAAKLAAKFGPVGDATKETFGWELIEPIKRTNGAVLPFKTNWASAYVSSSYSDGVILEMKMIDFRIMWQDDVKLNRAPRDKAIGDLSL